MGTELNDPERRALSAYLRDAGAILPTHVQELSKDGKAYVVVSDEEDGVLAVYRLRNDGMLRLMKRPPKDL